jgi:plastocyanin
VASELTNGMRSPRVRAGAALFLVVTLLGVNDAAATAQASTPRAGRTTMYRRATANRVKIVDFAFRPRAITVPRGTRVTWANRGNATHTSTSSSGLWDSGLLSPGESFSRVFRRAGTFRYKCKIHPAMVGKVIVG